MNLLIIGAGNMGLTYGHSFINSGVVSRDHLFFLERTASKAAEVRDVSHNPVYTEPGEYIRTMDLIILAVKPQDFRELAAALRPHLHQDHILLSIMAGIRVSVIQEVTGVEKVVRAMPNLPAQVGMGMTAFTTSDQVSRVEIFSIQNLLNTTGKTIYTPEEEKIDVSTAISGSGPAFVFYFMQAMIEAGREMGFSDAESQLLVKQTFLGSVNLLHQNEFSCEEWIRRVSSKGGTTEAAIQTFTTEEVMPRIKKGLRAAFERAVALSGGN